MRLRFGSGRRTERRLRNGGTDGSREVFDVKGDAGLRGRRGQNARFSAGAEGTRPVADEAVHRFAACVYRGADAMGGGIVLNGRARRVVAVVLMRRDRRANRRGKRDGSDGRNRRRPRTEPIKHRHRSA